MPRWAVILPPARLALPAMDSSEWRPGEAAALLANPFYCIELHPALSDAGLPLVPESQWVAANARAIDDLGPRVWLRGLLRALQGEQPTADEAAYDRELAAALVASPQLAVRIDPAHCEPHETVIDRETWVEANARAIYDDSARVFLQNLLSVLRGAYPAANQGRTQRAVPCGSGRKFKHCCGA